MLHTGCFTSSITMSANMASENLATVSMVSMAAGMRKELMEWKKT